jgi:hypothetical protein
MKTKVRKIRWGLAILALAALAIGCQGGVGGPATGNVSHTQDALSDGNGLDPNGLDGNGLDGNGLDGNGLDGNGLDGNGLDANGLDGNGLPGSGLGSQAAAQFKSWFSRHLGQPGADSAKIMKYVAKCALAAGQSLTFTVDGTAYSFPGSLGLAPVWTSNQPIPIAEQELISACLGAHINANGQSLMVSFHGAGLPVTYDEFHQFNTLEGFFFGNIFNGGSIYAVFYNTARLANPNDPSQGLVPYLTPRGCSSAQACAPLVNVSGTGYTYSWKSDIGGGGHATQATVSGQGYTYYHPITTYVVPPS